MRTALELWLNERPEILLAVLFGSFASGREHAQSDVDLAIGAAGPLSIDERVALHLSLSRALDREVDIVDLHTAHGLILGEALQGEWLRRSDLNLLTRIATRHVYEQADFAPLLERAHRQRRQNAFYK